MTPNLRSSGKLDFEFHGLKRGMVKIIETLRKDPMRFNQLCNETGLARRYVGRYLKELMARGMVAHDAKRKPYRLLPEGLKISWGLSDAQFLELHSPSFFINDLGIEGPPVEGVSVAPMIVDFSFSASLSHDRPIGAVSEIFRKRMDDAGMLLVREIARLAVSNGLLRKSRSGKLDVRRIPRRRWREIFKRLCPGGHELIYRERIDLHDLLQFLTHPRSWESIAAISVEISPTARTRRH